VQTAIKLLKPFRTATIIVQSKEADLSVGLAAIGYIVNQLQSVEGKNETSNNAIRKKMLEIVETRLSTTMLSTPLLLLAFFSGAVDFKELRKAKKKVDNSMNHDVQQLLTSRWALSLTDQDTPSNVMHFLGNVPRADSFRGVVAGLRRYSPYVADVIDVVAHRSAGLARLRLG
jgi:hypothetical protein